MPLAEPTETAIDSEAVSIFCCEDGSVSTCEGVVLGDREPTTLVIDTSGVENTEVGLWVSVVDVTGSDSEVVMGFIGTPLLTIGSVVSSV